MLGRDVVVDVVVEREGFQKLKSFFPTKKSKSSIQPPLPMRWLAGQLIYRQIHLSFIGRIHFFNGFKTHWSYLLTLLSLQKDT
jgi:hypothetical protein